MDAVTPYYQSSVDAGASRATNHRIILRCGQGNARLLRNQKWCKSWAPWYSRTPIARCAGVTQTRSIKGPLPHRSTQMARAQLEFRWPDAMEALDDGGREPTLGYPNRGRPRILYGA